MAAVAKRSSRDRCVRHSAFLSPTEVVFEAHQVEWHVNALVDDPFPRMVVDAFDAWCPDCRRCLENRAREVLRDPTDRGQIRLSRPRSASILGTARRRLFDHADPALLPLVASAGNGLRRALLLRRAVAR
jgi:hypothetical protein